MSQPWCVVVKFTCWFFSLTAEAKKSAAAPSAESASPAKPPDSVEVQPKGDVVEAAPPTASVELSVEDTADEGVHSNKTSVESLREANENNSNSAGLRLQTGRCWGLRRGNSAAHTRVPVVHEWRTCFHEVSSAIAAVQPAEFSCLTS